MEYRRAVRQITLPKALRFWLPWSLIFGVGVFLRLYLVDEQVILDDEWHSIDFAMNNSMCYLWTHYSRLGATCIPLNLFCRFILTYLGLSELALLAPSLVAGILSLLVFPALLRRIFNDRITLIFTSLLAVSPLLIFYSRDGRPYSLYAFFGFLSVLFLYFWSSTGQRKYAFLYAIASVLAIYIHMLAVVVVFSPLLFLILQTLVSTERHTASSALECPIAVARLEYATTLIAIVLLLALLLAYPLLHSMTPLTSGETDFTLYSVTGLLSLLSGTSNKLVMLIAICLFSYAYVHLYQSNKLLSSIFFAVVLGYLCALLISTPTLASMPIVLARYVVPTFPIYYLVIAIGISGLLDRVAAEHRNEDKAWWRERCYWLVLSICLIVPLWLGPLSSTYAQPNNFTNHSAFQESYEPFDWQTPRPSDFYMPYSRPAESMPTFYKQLAGDPKAEKIIEYPLMAGNHFNPFYYYQHFHKKKVLAGFVNSVKLKEKQSKGYIVGNYYIDFILGKAPDQTRLKFKNLINIENLAEVKISGADYLILHKNIISEMFPQTSLDTQKNLHFGWEVYPAVDKMKKIYQTFSGSPQYEDKDIVVYRLNQH